MLFNSKMRNLRAATGTPPPADDTAALRDYYERRTAAAKKLFTRDKDVIKLLQYDKQLIDDGCIPY